MNHNEVADWVFQPLADVLVGAFFRVNLRHARKTASR
jgi:hypothetical protein